MKSILSLLTVVLLVATHPLVAEDNKAPASEPLKAHLLLTPADKAKAADLEKTYPLTTCVVSGDKLGGMGETVDALYGDRLIRFCCKGCLKSFNKTPDKYLKEIDAAKKPAV